MRHFGYQRAQYHCPVVNLDRIWSLAGLNVEDFQGKKEAPVIDVTQFGFFKVLGNGDLPKVPVIVKAKLFSKSATEKIQAVGGACVLTA
jgi:large subunit ribosomal protein L27Ae